MSDKPKRKKKKKAKATKGVSPAAAKVEAEEVVEAARAKSSRGPGIARGVALCVVGFGVTFLLMANDEQVARGPLWGMLAMLVGTAGVLDLFGLFHRAGGDTERVELRDTALFALEGERWFFAPVYMVPLALVVGALMLLVQGQGALGLPLASIAALPFLIVPGLRRPSLMVVAVACGLLLPFLGSYGLWDPWETHYGEVAREMLARDDWISLWWAQEDFFWSKPILIFWTEALSMGALGVDFHPDANPTNPEIALRLPHFLLALGAMLGVYHLVAKVWNRRAGLLAGVVLCTMPHFFFLSHQAITDMPFVANMTMAMCALGLAVTGDGATKLKRFGIGPLTFSGRHVMIGLVTLVVLPQVLYLMSRNVSFLGGFPPFGWHGDVFMSGSGGNHGVPGNSAIRNVEPYLSGLGAQPASQALLWLSGYLGLIWLIAREDTRRGQLMFAFYFFCGLSFMAKGIPGFALPGLVALLFLISTRRWELLRRGHLKVGAGMLAVVTIGMPWYVAMFIRHGPPFTNRLLVHDHLNRLTSGVHMDETRAGSIGYFVEQMGYGMFPWVALAPLALAVWFARRPNADSSRDRFRHDTAILAALWLAASFTLFSAMTTKFHHYIFPAVPPAAILMGLAVDRLLRPRGEGLDLRRIGSTALALLAPIPAVLGVAGRWGDVRGILPEGMENTDWALEHPWPVWGTTLLIAGAVALLGGAWWLGRGPDATVEEDPRGKVGWARGAMATGLLAATPLLALAGRDMSWVTDARPQGYERLIHLFVYNYGRPWPTELDYRPILTGFAIVGVVIVVVAAIRPVRDVAMRAFVGLSMLFCVWALDVYMIDLSPHWGQRELVQRYYDLRASEDEPLIAWQMNWKGENFYTGNRVHVFVQLDNRALREWLGQNRGRTAYFMLEHQRLANLRSVMRDTTIEELTDPRFCNKFVLVRATIGHQDPTVRDERD